MRRNLVGERFGRLLVIAAAEDLVSETGYHTVRWKCVCDCGNEVVVRGKCLTQGVTRSCGCLQREEISFRATKHHGFGTRLYNVWNSMRQRCNNSHNKAYKNYGGRGVSICREWDDYEAFRAWAYNSGYDDNAPRGVLTLDRIDVNGPYSPENCRWVSMREQASNKRDTLFLEYDGECKPLAEWARKKCLDYTTVWKRYVNGLSAERILSPVFR